MMEMEKGEKRDGDGTAWLCKLPFLVSFSETERKTDQDRFFSLSFLLSSIKKVHHHHKGMVHLLHLWPWTEYVHCSSRLFSSYRWILFFTKNSLSLINFLLLQKNSHPLDMEPTRFYALIFCSFHLYRTTAGQKSISRERELVNHLSFVPIL